MFGKNSYTVTSDAALACSAKTHHLERMQKRVERELRLELSLEGSKVGKPGPRHVICVVDVRSSKLGNLDELLLANVASHILLPFGLLVLLAGSGRAVRLEVLSVAETVVCFQRPDVRCFGHEENADGESKAAHGGFNIIEVSPARQGKLEPEAPEREGYLPSDRVDNVGDKAAPYKRQEGVETAGAGEDATSATQEKDLLRHQRDK